MAAKRVILDTNLLISFLISHKLDSIDDLLLHGKITLLFSNELIEEFITVASRPKFKKYFSSVYFLFFTGQMEYAMRMIIPVGEQTFCSWLFQTKISENC